MKNANLYSLFFDHFPEDGNAVFLDGADGMSLSYAELHHQSGQLITLLQNNEVEKGSRIVVQVEKSIESVVLYLACLRTGAVYIPLNPAYTAAEVEYFMGDATPQVFICTPERRAELERLADQCEIPHTLTLGSIDANGVRESSDISNALEKLPSSDEIVSVDEDDLAAILYTSGTTGRSKGAMLSHRNLAANAKTLHEYWHWENTDVLLHALPIFHVHGLFVALHCALLGGSRVNFLPRFNLDKVIEKLPNSTVMMGVPTFYTRLLASEEFTLDICSNMRLFISGSAPLLAETHRLFEQRISSKILERYGMTETGMITSNPYEGDRVAGTVGFALPGNQVRVTDDNGDVLPTGKAGILETTGPNVFSGYWQMPDKTAEEFRSDGWFITGDIAVIDETGRVSIVGREKDLIISGGMNIYPSEVEDKINQIPGIKESAVIAVRHADFGEAVVAVIVTDGSEAITSQTVNYILRDQLAGFKRPKNIIFVDDLPRNTMGKVQKNTLREKYKELCL